MAGVWTAAEDTILAEHYPTGGTAACAPLLPGRDPVAIRKRASLHSILRDGYKAPPGATPYRAGDLNREAAGVLADRCARRILVGAGPRAVTVDPEGSVWVETPDDAAEVDLVGVFDPELGLVALTHMIRDDLVAARRELRSSAPAWKGRAGSRPGLLRIEGESLTLREVAERLRVAPSTARARVRRAQAAPGPVQWRELAA